MASKVKQKHGSLFLHRVNTVVELIMMNERYLQSKKMAELRLFVSEHIKCSPRQAERYIAEALEQIAEITKMDAKKALERARRRREYLWKKANESKDYKLALEVEKDSAKIEGLYTENINATGTLEVVRKIINNKEELDNE